MPRFLKCLLTGFTLGILVNLTVLLLTVVADCTPGDTRCGADGYVQRCDYEGKRWDITFTRCKKEKVCSPGASRCGADGYVERCDYDGEGWQPSAQKCR